MTTVSGADESVVSKSGTGSTARTLSEQSKVTSFVPGYNKIACGWGFKIRTGTV